MASVDKKSQQVKLQSGGDGADQQIFTVDRDIAEMSGTIKNILEGLILFFFFSFSFLFFPFLLF
jgi:hypothetical protein